MRGRIFRVLAALAFNTFATVYYITIGDIAQPALAIIGISLLWVAWIAIVLLNLLNRDEARAQRITLTLSGFCVAVAVAVYFIAS